MIKEAISTLVAGEDLTPETMKQSILLMHWDTELRS